MRCMGRPAKEPQPSYGRHLADLRKASGLSQQRLADLLKVRQSTVASWERSPNPPKGEFLAPLAKTLKVSLDTLLRVKTDTTPARHRGPSSKFESMVDAVATLPRRRQQRIANLLETLIAQETAEARTA